MHLSHHHHDYHDHVETNSDLCRGQWSLLWPLIVVLCLDLSLSLSFFLSLFSFFLGLHTPTHFLQPHYLNACHVHVFLCCCLIALIMYTFTVLSFDHIYHVQNGRGTEEEKGFPGIAGRKGVRWRPVHEWFQCVAGDDDCYYWRNSVQSVCTFFFFFFFFKSVNLFLKLFLLECDRCGVVNHDCVSIVYI